MKRVGKKWLSALVAVALSLSSQAAWAASSVVDPARTGSLTFYKYDMTKIQESGKEGSYVSGGKVDAAAEQMYRDFAVEGVEFTYLKVAEAVTETLAGSGGEAQVRLVYELSRPAEELLGRFGLEKKADSRYTAEELSGCLRDAVADEISGRDQVEVFVKAQGGVSMPKTDASGRTSAAGLPLGLYLVAETAVPESVVETVAPFFVSLPMTGPKGESWLYDVVAYPKNMTDQPNLQKQVAKASLLTYGDSTTAEGGEALAYRISSHLPEINSKATYLTEYTFEDTLGAGLSYKKDSVKLTWRGPSGQTVVWNGTEAEPLFTAQFGEKDGGETTLRIEMTAAGLAQINPNFSKWLLEVDYQATFTGGEAAAYGAAGNKNQVELTWRRTNRDSFGVLQDDCRVYSYGLKFKKSFTPEGGDYREVEFLLEHNGAWVKAEEKAAGIYYVTGVLSEKDAATVFIPSEAGELRVYGLDAAPYIVTEIATADGYALLKEPIQVELRTEETEGSRSARATVNGREVTLEAAGESAAALVPAEIMNEKVFVLPKTGDTQNIWLPLLGILMGSLSIVMYRYYGKREEQ